MCDFSSQPFRLFFIIPVLDELNIWNTLYELDQNAFVNQSQETTIILVDDFSAVPVTNIGFLQKSKLELVRHSQNMGPGAAFRTGFNRLPSQLGNNDFVITIEGDGTSDLDLLNRMYCRINESNLGYDVVIASPYTFGGKFLNTSRVRRLLSSVANLLTRNLLGLQGIWTLSSFYRIYRGSSLNHIRLRKGTKFISLNGYEGVIEILYHFARANFTISEVPLIVNQNKRVGKSRMKVIRTIIGYMKLWIRLRCSTLKRIENDN